jgi:hypothetical protein
VGHDDPLTDEPNDQGVSTLTFTTTAPYGCWQWFVAPPLVYSLGGKITRKLPFIAALGVRLSTSFDR